MLKLALLGKRPNRQEANDLNFYFKIKVGVKIKMVKRIVMQKQKCKFVSCKLDNYNNSKKKNAKLLVSC